MRNTIKHKNECDWLILYTVTCQIVKECAQPYMQVNLSFVSLWFSFEYLLLYHIEDGNRFKMIGFICYITTVSSYILHAASFILLPVSFHTKQQIQSTLLKIFNLFIAAMEYYDHFASSWLPPQLYT